MQVLVSEPSSCVDSEYHGRNVNFSKDEIDDVSIQNLKAQKLDKIFAKKIYSILYRYLVDILALYPNRNFFCLTTKLDDPFPKGMWCITANSPPSWNTLWGCSKFISSDSGVMIEL